MQVALRLLGIVVLCYSLGVLVYVAGDPQPGIHCLLRGSNERGPRIAVQRNLEYRGDRPQTGDRIVALGGRPVPTFIHFQRSLGAISQQPLETTADDDAPLDLAARLAEHPDVLDHAGQRWVRVDFLRNETSAHSAWVRLKPISPTALLVAGTWCALELLIFGIGALVVSRRPGDVSAMLFYVLCAVQVVMFLGAFHWPSLVDARVLMYPFLACTVLLAPLMLHFHLLFPRPAWIVRRWPRGMLAAVYAVPALSLLVMFGYLIRMTWLYETEATPAALMSQLHAFVVLMYAYLGLSLAMFLAGQALLVRSFLRARTLAERNQVKWLLASMFVGIWPVGYLLYTSTWQPDEFVFGLGSKAMMYATSAIFAIGYAVSITRYKLMQASRIVDRGLLYVAISFSATVVFCALVGLATMLVGRYVFSWENAAAAGLTAMLTVVLLGFLRDRFQRALDRRFHQQKYQLDKAMSRLSEAVDQLVEPSQLARQLLQAARDAVRADRGAVYLREANGTQYELAAWTGWPPMPQHLEWEPHLAGTTVSVHHAGRADSLPLHGRLRDLQAMLACPLELDGETVGLVILGAKQDQTPYTAEDRVFLSALVQTTALALRSARVYRTIEALRQQLQEKIEKVAEQQQRIHFLQSELLHRGDTSTTTSAADVAPMPKRPATPRALPPRRHMIGSSVLLQGLLSEAAKVAGSNSSVLIRGESGTGKELLAQTIHEQSRRAGKAFVAVHCAALSPGLLESELFGHVRGAFTGAERDKTGRFELAHHGTLFLDEIGDISLETQTKLLRVLQERSFERVGGSRTIQVDVRLITATHQDLEALIRAGRFREDLYYRLNVISLRCPPLRERREDVFELALHFLQRYAAEAGKEIVRIEDDAVEALAAYSWPGNVRQLENAIQRAVVLAEGDSLRAADLPPEILDGQAPRLRTLRYESQAPRSTRRRGETTQEAAVALAALDEELQSLERERLRQAIARAGGNKAAAARLLGLPRSTFFSKLRKFGID